MYIMLHLAWNVAFMSSYRRLSVSSNSLRETKFQIITTTVASIFTST
ncbi:hypothetical protein HMPREF3192_01222 [Atopobium deltae]|uniref:Uncharacterized protein n=1 Tax=Atopobium deltae TaxID=1393034 RepID=A0A133XQP3_9ACTN|nr:hypothetical protein HMPREF3192_01222 [Atopobium deltae]